MKMQTKQIHWIWLILILLLVCCKTKSKQKSQPKYFTSPSNLYISNQNFTSTIKQHLLNNEQNNLIGILFTNKNCQTCITTENQLLNIIKDFSQSKIPLFRCQLANNQKLAEKFSVKRFPIIHYVLKLSQKQGKKTKETLKIYKSYQIVTESIIQHALYLKSSLQLMIQVITKQRNYNKVHGNIANIKSKLMINMQILLQTYNIIPYQFIKSYHLNELFSSFHFILLDNFQFQLNLIQHNIQNGNQLDKTIIFMLICYQKDHCETFSNKHLESYQQNQNYLDLFFKSLIFYNTNQFTQQFFQVRKQIDQALRIQTGKNTYLAILDSIWNRQQAQNHIKMLNNIIKSFDNQISIFWTEGQINPQKKILLGFDKNHQAPLFGKLVLIKSEPKFPLMDKKNIKPLFSEESIKKIIRSDLGYEKLVQTKIRTQIQQMQVSHLIQVKNGFLPNITSNQLNIIYFTLNCLSQGQISQLSKIIKRIKRFYLQTKLSILTQNNFQTLNIQKEGLYIVFRRNVYLVSNQIQNCYNVQNNIKQITDMIAFTIKRNSLIPKYFCVNQHQMLHYLQLNM